MTAPQLYELGAFATLELQSELAQSGPLTATVEHSIPARREHDAPVAQRFAAEVWGRLFGWDVRRLDEASVAWAEAVHECVQQVPEWTVLEGSAANDPYLAGVGAAKVVDAVLSQIPEELPDLSEAKERLDEALENVNHEDRATRREARKQAARAAADIQAAEQAAAELAAALRSPERARGLRMAVSGAAAGAVAACAELGDVGELAGPPGATRGPLPGSSLATERRGLQASATRDPKVAKIAKLAGRMRSSVRAHAKVAGFGMDEVHAIETGGNVERLLPSEKVLLAAGGMAGLSVLARVAERRAMQYAVRAKERKERGPIVCVVDESGSMDLGNRIVWAKSIALALAERCAVEKRPLALVKFGYAAHAEIFHDPAAQWADIVAWCLSTESYGGTSIAAGLLAAADVVRAVKWGKRADVVLVTDGQDTSLSSDEVRGVLRAAFKHTAIHAFLLAGGMAYECRELCASVTEIDALTDDDVPTNLLPTE